MIVPLTIIAAFGLFLAILVATVSRHKKSGTGSVRPIGATGVVETKLDPAGTVIIDGELWRARSKGGAALGPTNKVSVVALEDHFLLVEIVPNKL